MTITQPESKVDETRSAPTRRWSDRAFIQLVLSRFREFYREPEAVFWAYIFPILMVIGLGIAFRNRPVEQIAVDVESGPQSRAALSALGSNSRFVVRRVTPRECAMRLRTGKTQLVVSAAGDPPAYRYQFDPTRPESVLARNAVDDALERAAGRVDRLKTSDETLVEPGGRYVDFLVPGLIGMSLMGGGLWGVGFVTVDMRIRKLVKRFLATPMKKRDFLAAIMVSRMLFHDSRSLRAACLCAIRLWRAVLWIALVSSSTHIARGDDVCRDWVVSRQPGKDSGSRVWTYESGDAPDVDAFGDFLHV